MDPLPPYTAVVLAGGKAARLGGQAKPQLEVGGRTMLATVLAAVADAAHRVVVGPPQAVPSDVLLVRERPPGGGPVAALRAGLAEVPTDVVAVLAGDLPVPHRRRSSPSSAPRLTGDGVLVVDDGGRDQYLLGVWRTAALRAAAAGAEGPTSLRRVLAPLAVDRYHPAVEPGTPAAVDRLRHPRRPRPRPRRLPVTVGRTARAATPAPAGAAAVPPAAFPEPPGLTARR